VCGSGDWSPVRGATRLFLLFLISDFHGRKKKKKKRKKDGRVPAGRIRVRIDTRGNNGETWGGRGGIENLETA